MIAGCGAFGVLLAVDSRFSPTKPRDRSSWTSNGPALNECHSKRDLVYESDRTCPKSRVRLDLRNHESIEVLSRTTRSKSILFLNASLIGPVDGEILVHEPDGDGRDRKSAFDSFEKNKTTAPRIPAWSPTVVLTRRHFG